MSRKQTELGAKLADPDRSPWKKYQELVVGREGVFSLLRYEFLTFFFGPLSGALGFWLRGRSYPRLLRQVGRGTVFGKNLTLRHPHKIAIGRQVTIDDYCVLDAKGEQNNGIVLGDNVLISRNTVLGCKGGDIIVGSNSNVANNSLLHSETCLRLGENVLVGAYSYLVAGGTHGDEDPDLPIMHQASRSKGGILLEDNVWLGANVKVLDGARIGRDTIIGAGSVVTGEIPEFSVAVGIPARVIRKRGPRP